MLLIDLSKVLEGNYKYLVSALMFLLIGAAIEKFKLKTILFHSRLLWRILLILLIAFLPLLIPRLAEFIFAFLLVTAALIAYLTWTIWIPFFYEEALLKVLFHKKLIRKKLILPKPNYSKLFLSTPGKLKYNLRLIKLETKHRNLHHIPDAFQNLNALKLFPNEKDEAHLQQCLFYQNTGSYSKLKYILEQTSANFKNSAEYSFLLADLCRIGLDVDGFYSNSILALEKKSIRKNNSSFKVILYNNLAVSSLSRGNKEDHKRHLLESIKHLDANDENKHVLYPNLIDNRLLTNEWETAKQSLRQYKQLIDFKDFNDTLAWYNYLIEYNRQINNNTKVCDLIDEMDLFFEKHYTLSEDEKAMLMGSGLRMRFNGCCNWQDNFAIISSNLTYYTNLRPDVGYVVVRELLDIMGYQQNKGLSFNAIEKVVAEVVAFMKNYLIVLDNKLDTLGMEFVNERCTYLQQKTDIITRLSSPVNHREQMEAFENKIRLFHDKVLILAEQGNKLEELITRCVIIDEVASLDYNTVASPINYREIYLSMFEKFLPEIQEQLGKCWHILHYFLNDKNSYVPEINGYLLLLSYYYLTVTKDSEKSKQLFEKFKQSKISLAHYKQVFRHFYMRLEELHGS